MNLYEATGVVFSVVGVGAIFLRLAWQLGKSGRTEPALATWKELATALEAQNADQQKQLDHQAKQLAEMRGSLSTARVEIARLNEQVTQRAAVEELTAQVVGGFDRVIERVDEVGATLISQIARAR